jgi:hypothetical protein
MFFPPIPKFHSINLKKEIKQNTTVIKWIGVTGILDQDFPDYITIRKGNLTDTICEAHNIADLIIDTNQIIIGFYGSPRRYSRIIQIPEYILGYTIEVDTLYTTTK